MGPEATALLSALAQHSQEYPARAFLLHAHRRLSCTLQSSNANIALLAMQQWHLSQHAKDSRTHERHLERRAQTLSQYAEPHNSDLLWRQLRAQMSSTSAGE